MLNSENSFLNYNDLKIYFDGNVFRLKIIYSLTYVFGIQNVGKYCFGIVFI